MFSRYLDSQAGYSVRLLSGTLATSIPRWVFYPSSLVESGQLVSQAACSVRLCPCSSKAVNLILKLGTLFIRFCQVITSFSNWVICPPFVFRVAIIGPSHIFAHAICVFVKILCNVSTIANANCSLPAWRVLLCAGSRLSEQTISFVWRCIRPCSGPRTNPRLMFYQGDSQSTEPQFLLDVSSSSVDFPDFYPSHAITCRSVAVTVWLTRPACTARTSIQ